MFMNPALQQFFRDPQSGQGMMMPQGAGGAAAGVGVMPSFDVDPAALQGVEYQPGGAGPLPPYAGGGGAEPMPPSTFGGGGGAVPLGAQPLPPVNPMRPGRGQPLPPQGGGSAQPLPMPPPRGRVPADLQPGVRRDMSGAQAQQPGGGIDPRMEDEKKRRLIEAVMRARGLIA